jgi:hypothetical protein
MFTAAGWLLGPCKQSTNQGPGLPGGLCVFKGKDLERTAPTDPLKAAITALLKHMKSLA